MRNKANSLGCPEMGAARQCRQRALLGQLRKTKPMPGGEDIPPFHYSIIPILCCETKPISRPRPEQAGRSGSQRPAPRSRILRNKANSLRARTMVSAFWKSSCDTSCPYDGLEKTKPISCRRVGTDAGQRSGEEAPAGEQPCKTKPICADGQGSGKDWQGRLYRQRWVEPAKQSQFPARRDGACGTEAVLLLSRPSPVRPLALPGPILQNKANPLRARVAVCACNTSSYDTYCPTGASKKQSQFRGGRRGIVDLGCGLACRPDPDYASRERILDERYRKLYLFQFRVVAGWHEVFPSNRKTLIL